MNSGKVILTLTAGLLLVNLSGCAVVQNVMQSLPFKQGEPAKRTVGRAMIREEVPLEVYTRPGAGGIGPDGKLVIASNVPHFRPKQPVDACGNVITPHFNSAELNDDQRTLKNLIAQQERQLRTARTTAFSANNPALKDLARDMMSSDKREIERLNHLRRQLCKESHVMVRQYKVAHAH